MEANLSINGKTVRVNDESLANLNVLLKGLPLCEEKYNQQTGQYEYPPNAAKHLQIEAVFELKSKIVAS